MSKVLIVDDDVTFCLMLETFLQKKGFEVQQSFSYADAIKKIKAFVPDIILTDLRLPDHDGLEVMHFALRESSGVPVILMTGYADIRTAVQAMKLGAFDYVAKPVNPDEIIVTINRALSQAKTPGNAAQGPGTEMFFVEGTSPAAQKISDYVRLVAPTGMSVLIMGESGTGKEFVARKIHQMSTRSDKPFVAIDCGALPRDLAGSEFFGHLKGSFTGAFADKPGQFEAANGGTIFLDEIGNLGYDIQVQLLRAIQERKVRRIGSTSEIPIDVRIITATNDDLKKSVVSGEFREDLYHRINEFAIQVSPLRDRHEDLVIFTGHFLDQANRELGRNVDGFSAGVIDVFSRYSWPGNFRELKNIIKRAVLLSTGDIININTLPEEIIKEAEINDTPVIKTDSSAVSIGMNLKETAHRSERELILSTLEKVRFNKSKAAKILNIDRKTLYNKMKQFGIPLQ
ncbi:MAG: sigma-54-dependent Fis family transcriptional regulator [Bacteroidales bacterium]|nr:sigma-54-dependent Fis family transcriptional regulator [Bacteroidales bacterium]MBK9358496.1 sigma-54-dependent Fis family transcriptional regulator [Bacteroidales bacterium]